MFNICIASLFFAALILLQLLDSYQVSFGSYVETYQKKKTNMLFAIAIAISQCPKKTSRSNYLLQPNSCLVYMHGPFCDMSMGLFIIRARAFYYCCCKFFMSSCKKSLAADLIDGLMWQCILQLLFSCNCQNNCIIPVPACDSMRKIAWNVVCSCNC